MDTHAAVARAGDLTPSRSRRAAIFAVVSTALLMSSLDQTIVATALHSLQGGLDSSITWASWTITAYSLGMVVMLPVAGKLSDRHGRRRVFVLSVIVFTTASLCCGLVDNIYLLVILRAVQAAGGAGFTPSATGIVVEHFGSARDKAVGLFGSIFPIGAILGPILGGVFVTYWSWRGIFLVNVPIGAVLIPLTLRFVPADQRRSEPSGGGVDLAGVALLGAGVLAAMIGFTVLGDGGVSPWSWRTIGLAAVAVLALGLFMRHIAHRANPFIAPRLIYGRGFGAVNSINLLYGGAVAGLVALIPLYATTRYGISALDSGTLLAAQGVAVILLSILAAFLLRRTGYRGPLYLGCAVVAVGIFGLAVTPLVGSPYAWLAMVGCVIGVGLGWSAPASRNACLQLAPKDASALAALRSQGRQIGSIMSISIASAVIAQASDPGAAQAYVYGASAMLLAVGLPLIARVPEHRGSW